MEAGVKTMCRCADTAGMQGEQTQKNQAKAATGVYAFA